MLTEDALKESLQDADKAAKVCRPWCRYGGAVEAGKLHLWHNGLGPSDSDEQMVFSDGTLQLGQAGLTTVLGAWLEHLHKKPPGKRYDLNTRAEA
jgi:hypothetical protein